MPHSLPAGKWPALESSEYRTRFSNLEGYAMWNTWDLLNEVDALHREIDRVFRGVDQGEWDPSRFAFLPGRAARSYPMMNLYEDGEEYLAEALAPGLNPDSLEVAIQKNMLTISGEKAGLKDVKPEAFHRAERAAGKFVRTISLGSEVDEAKDRPPARRSQQVRDGARFSSRIRRRP